MDIHGNILEEVKKRARDLAGRIPDREIYESPRCGRYFQNLAMTLLDDPDIRVRLLYEPDSETAACTSGREIVLNAANSIASHFETQLGRFRCNLGILFHECAHCLYLDFEADRAERKRIEEGKIRIPARTDPETAARMARAAADPAGRRVIQALLHQLHNVIADAHDENRMMEDHGNMVRDGILQARASMAASCLPLEDMQDMPPLTILTSMILEYGRFRDIVVLDEAALHSVWAEKFREIEDLVDKAVETDSIETRYGCMTEILGFLWPYVEELLEKGSPDRTGMPDSSGESRCGSGGETASDETARQVLEEIRRAAEAGGSGDAPETPEKRTKSDVPRKGSASGTADDNTEKMLEGMQKEAARSMAEAEAEQAVACSDRAVVCGMQTGELHREIKVTVRRDLELNGTEQACYDTVCRETDLYGRALAKSIQTALRESGRDGISSRRTFGPILRASESYRRDGKYFYRRHVPGERPDLAVLILLDCSGSMRGERIEAVKNASVLMEAVCARIGIPIMIAGHHMERFGEEMAYEIFVPFVRADRRDRYRLMHISPGGCNRDGLAIRTSAEYLRRRPEQVRLLLLVSDGQPSDLGYGGETAKQDIQEKLRTAARQGISFFAAGIGSDRDTLREIYGERYLDISDLAALPRRLGTLLKQKICT